MEGECGTCQSIDPDILCANEAAGADLAAAQDSQVVSRAKDQHEVRRCIICIDMMPLRWVDSALFGYYTIRSALLAFQE